MHLPGTSVCTEDEREIPFTVYVYERAFNFGGTDQAHTGRDAFSEKVAHRAANQFRTLAKTCICFFSPSSRFRQILSR